MLSPSDRQRIDCKCWICGVYTKPEIDSVFGPLICLECLPEYKKRKFVFVRASQAELDEIFSTKKGFTCQ